MHRNQLIPYVQLNWLVSGAIATLFVPNRIKFSHPAQNLVIDAEIAHDLCE